MSFSSYRPLPLDLTDGARHAVGGKSRYPNSHVGRRRVSKCFRLESYNPLNERYF